MLLLRRRRLALRMPGSPRPLSAQERSVLERLLSFNSTLGPRFAQQIPFTHVVREGAAEDDPSVWLSHSPDAKSVEDVERFAIADGWARDVDGEVIELIVHCDAAGYLRCLELYRQIGGP